MDSTGKGSTHKGQPEIGGKKLAGPYLAGSGNKHSMHSNNLTSFIGFIICLTLILGYTVVILQYFHNTTKTEL